MRITYDGKRDAQTQPQGTSGNAFGAEKRGRGTEGVVGQEVAGKQKDIDR